MNLNKAKNTVNRYKRSYKSLLKSTLRVGHAHDKYFYLSFHKCGTQYTMGFLRRVCQHKNLDWHKVDWRRKLKRHHVLGTDFMLLSDYSSENNSPFQFSDKLKGFVVYRDPRDVLVSLYFSHRYSHGENATEITTDRQALADMSFTDGLDFLFTSSSYFKRMLYELEKLDTESADLQFVRFEDLVKNPVAEFDGIFRNLGLEVPPALLEKIHKEINFEKLKKKSNTADSEKPGHYRSGKHGDWKNHFDDKLKERFKKLYGQQLVDLGYEKDLLW